MARTIRVRTRAPRRKRSSALVRTGRRRMVLYRTPRLWERHPFRAKYLPLTGFPARKLVRLRYTTVVNINPPASGNVAAHYFHANGMYDPDHTGAGHQPLGYDQWATIYDHYTVLSSKIHVQQTPNGTADTQSTFLPGVFGVFIDDDNNLSYSKVTEVIESKQNGAMASYRAYGYPQTLTGGVNPSIVKTFSTKRFFGIRNPIGKSDYRGAFIGSNPNEGAYFVLWAGAPDGAQDVPSMTFMVTIEYIAMCTEPKYIAQS